ncbi:hypothetical protein ABE85_07500 [Mitsuaria sp. 7]|nr:hypothetical protein ABE85_07500 [Mitsuaria sp. 7]
MPWPDGLETSALRVQAVKAFAAGIADNDSEAIQVGWQGKQGWDKAVRRAEVNATAAEDPAAFGLTLRTLYASYPSLHSRIDLRSDLDYRTTLGHRSIPFTMKVRELGPDIIPDAVLIADTAKVQIGLAGPGAAVGDQVLTINGRPIGHWLSKSAQVCRRNSRWQCYGDFDKQLRTGLLGWDPRRPLTLGISRNGSRKTITYQAPSTPDPADPRVRTGCGQDDERYEGFTAVYTGWNLCAFRSAARPGVEIWRLKSFSYGTEATFDSPKTEVEGLWEKHWSTAASSVKELIIDVSGNGGGDVPLPWYSLLFDQPYQEQYAQYRRLKAFDDPAIAAELPDDQAHERWLAGIKLTNSRAWRNVGGYLPPVAMFCAEEDLTCEGTLVKPKPHGFAGKVSLILDDNCVSSCSGFAWNILAKLGPRANAFGLPDSGDSNFRRLPLTLHYREGIWRTALGTNAAQQDKPIATVNVMVTRTTTSDGQVISGQSLPVRTVIHRRWDDTARSWTGRVLEEILQSRP